MKKLATMLSAGVVFLVLAVPALAECQQMCIGHLCWCMRDHNAADVTNTSTAHSNTGWNTQNNWNLGGGDIDDNDGNRYMWTGNATSKASSMAVVNSTDCCCEDEGCWCPGETNRARVRNGSEAMSDTGMNMQDDRLGGDERCDGGCHDGDIEHNDGDRTMYTGHARSTSRSWSVVNTSWMGGWR